MRFYKFMLYKKLRTILPNTDKAFQINSAGAELLITNERIEVRHTFIHIFLQCFNHLYHDSLYFIEVAAVIHTKLDIKKQFLYRAKRNYIIQARKVLSWG